MKQLKLDRIISVATLLVSVTALILVLKRPAPVAAPQTPAQAQANAQAFQEKIAQLDQPAGEAGASDASPSSQNPADNVASQASAPTSPQPNPTPAQVRITSDEVTAALAQASGALSGASSGGSSGQLAPGSELGAMPNILDQQISFDGDKAHGQFLVNIAGKNVWITVTGKLGSKDGYATFEPSEFKVGDLNVPVSLVNDVLQKRMAEQHDHMKLPDGVGGIKVENGQLVLTQK